MSRRMLTGIVLITATALSAALFAAGVVLVAREATLLSGVAAEQILLDPPGAVPITPLEDAPDEVQREAVVLQERLLETKRPLPPPTEAASPPSQPSAVDTPGTGEVRRVPGKGAPAPTSRSEGGIVQTGANAWLVPDGLVDGYFAEPKRLEELGYVVPEADGFALHGISPGTPLADLGLQSGDVLQSINGLPIRTRLQVLGAVARLRGAREVEVRFLRDGDPRTHRYVVQTG